MLKVTVNSTAMSAPAPRSLNLQRRGRGESVGKSLQTPWLTFLTEKKSPGRLGMWLQTSSTPRGISPLTVCEPAWWRLHLPSTGAREGVLRVACLPLDLKAEAGSSTSQASQGLAQ